jgi:hypothetical protein
MESAMEPNGDTTNVSLNQSSEIFDVPVLSTVAASLVEGIFKEDVKKHSSQSLVRRTYSWTLALSADVVGRWFDAWVNDSDASRMRRVMITLVLQGINSLFSLYSKRTSREDDDRTKKRREETTDLGVYWHHWWAVRNPLVAGVFLLGSTCRQWTVWDLEANNSLLRIA